MPSTEMNDKQENRPRTGFMPIKGFMLWILMGALVILSTALVPPPAAGQPADIYHDMIIATKDGGQGLQGEYKFRFASISDVEEERRDGGQGRGTISFSGNAVNGSVLGRSPCFTSIQAALESQEQVKMIKVTQGAYQEEIENTQNYTAIIQGGNDADFQSNPSSTTVTRLTGAGGTLILENMTVH